MGHCTDHCRMRRFSGGYRQFDDDEPTSPGAITLSAREDNAHSSETVQIQQNAGDMQRRLSSEDMQMLMKPASRNPHAGMVHCVVKREKGSISHKLFPQYTLVSSEGRMLMVATRKKAATPSWDIATEYCADKSSPSYLGKITTNVSGNSYIAYGAGHNPKKCQPNSDIVIRPELLIIRYKSGSTPKSGLNMHAIIPRIKANGEPCDIRPLDPEKDGLEAKVNAATRLTWHNELQELTQRSAVYDPTSQSHALSFESRGRVTHASVKNYVLECPEEMNRACFEFGRCGKDDFALSFRYPLSTFQAFAMALSSFGNKVTMEGPKMPDLFGGFFPGFG